MIIFKDIITNDEILSDVYKDMKLIDDMYYEVYPSLVKLSTEITDSMIGGNASAEGVDADDGADGSCVQTGLNVVLSHQLKEVNFGSTKQQKKELLKSFLKKYCKAVAGKLDADRKKVFMEKMPGFLKDKIMANIGNWDFYGGENWQEDDNPGMVILLDYRNDDSGNEYPYMIFLKDGMVEEKV